jgi:hypothetical protein
MARCYVIASFVLAACVIVSTGCVDTQRGAASRGGAGGKKRPLSDFKLGEYMPPLEDGRLELAPPQGWEFQRAGSEYLVAFVPQGRELNKLPRILMAAEDSPWPDVTQVNEGNVDSFVKRVKQLRSSEKFAEPPRAMILGENAFATYLTMAKRKGSVVVQQHLETVAGNRLYHMRLEVNEYEFQKHRDAANALAAGMKFGGTADASLPKTEPAAAEPAVKEEAKEGPKEEPKAKPAAAEKAT